MADVSGTGNPAAAYRLIPAGAEHESKAPTGRPALTEVNRPTPIPPLTKIFIPQTPTPSATYPPQPSPPAAAPCWNTGVMITEAQLHANQLNAEKSTGPRTPEGKHRSALNATRHGILGQVIHLPEAELAAYTAFTRDFAEGLKPADPVETQLANACADLQFRLHRLAAAEHNLFALGHCENGDQYDTGDPESHSALALAETFRRSKDPLALLTLYEQRLSRRLLQTLKHLREIQAERRALEQQQLTEMYAISAANPDLALTPAEFGFVCSNHDWQFFQKRRRLLPVPAGSRPIAPDPRIPRGEIGLAVSSERVLMQCQVAVDV